MCNELLPVLQRSTVPLYWYDVDGHHHALGSGCLFRLGRRSFIVTAAHVLHSIETLQLKPTTADLYNRGYEIPVFGPIFRLRHRETNDDPGFLDVGVLALDPACVEALRSFLFLEVSDLDAGMSPAPQGWYFMHGYPGECFAEEEILYVHQPYTHSAELYRDPGALAGYDARVHVAIGINRAMLQTPSGHEAVAPASLMGVSGGAIWRAARTEELASWTPHCARSVAVQTCEYRVGNDLIARGTRWYVVLSVLRRAFEDLAKEIDDLGLSTVELGEVV
jgi:hypothetical protein